MGENESSGTALAMTGTEQCKVQFLWSRSATIPHLFLVNLKIGHGDLTRCSFRRRSAL